MPSTRSDLVAVLGGGQAGREAAPGQCYCCFRDLVSWPPPPLLLLPLLAGWLLQECERCRVPCCVVTVPKSIDNDILLVDRCFGFDSAVEEAQKALLAGGDRLAAASSSLVFGCAGMWTRLGYMAAPPPRPLPAAAAAACDPTPTTAAEPVCPAAKVEASSAYRGVGLVKLMGRDSGFIAVQSSLASGVVDTVLIPEVGKHDVHGSCAQATTSGDKTRPPPPPACPTSALSGALQAGGRGWGD